MPKIFNASSSPMIQRKEADIDAPRAVMNLATDAVVSNALIDSMTQYQTFASQRKSELVDENGHLMANELATDLGEFGKSLLEDAAGTIEDERAKRDYRLQMQNYLSTQQTSLYDDYFNQVLEYSDQTLRKVVEGLDNLTKVDDPKNLDANLDTAGQYISQMEAAGALDSEVADEVRYEVDQKLRYNRIHKLIEDGDILTASELMQQDMLINDHMYEGLGDLAASKTVSQQRNEEKVADNQDQFEKQINALTYNEMVYGIKQGTMDDFTIQDMAINGLISEEQEFKLLKEFQKQNFKFREKQAKAREITNRLVQGQSVADISDKDLNDHYNDTLAILGMDEETGQPMPLSMQEKAQVALNYQRPMSAFQSELQYNLMNPNSPNAAAALEAYDMVLDRNPGALEGLDKKARAIATMALRSVDYTGSTPEVALQEATDRILKMDPATKKQHAEIFESLDDFQPKKIRDTIINEVGGFGESVAPGVIPVYTNLLRDAFIDTGDIELAKAMVKQQTEAYLGPTEFNEESGIIDDTEQVMFFPPEKMFPGIDIEVMKGNLAYELKEANLLPEGIEASSVRLISDNYTRQDGVDLNYGLSIVVETDEGPIEALIYDNQGTPVRWAPDYDVLKAAQENLDGIN